MLETTRHSSKTIRILIAIGKIILNILLALFIIYIIFNYSTIAEIFIPGVFKFITTPDLGNIIVLCILLTALLCFKKYLALSMQRFFSNLTNKYFMLSLAGLAIIGASAALFIPSYTNWFRENDSVKTQQPVSTPQPTQSGQDTGNQQKQESKNSASELRGHLLYITGGVIAVLGLIETNRKNSQDHIRQVHAARRERYIEAVDKLSSEYAPVRLGGVYALGGLVDEWLDDDNIDEKIRTKEGQIIINNLCSYIRSPFSLAEKREILEAPSNVHVYSGNLSEDEAKLREEQDVRRAIFEEMSKRSSTLDAKGKIINAALGMWSDFDFNFSRAPIFYPLSNLTIEKGIFTSAIFYGKADFRNTVFIGEAKFNRAKFTHEAEFYRSTFAENAEFHKSTFTRNADFQLGKFAGSADFRAVTFCRDADFQETIFKNPATFSGATFKQQAIFQNTRFYQIVNFIWTLFKKNLNNGLGANFINSTFNQGACFYESEFEGTTRFTGAKFLGDINFSRFDFSKATSETAPFFLKATQRNGITVEQSMRFSAYSKAPDPSDFIKRIADFSRANFEGKTFFNGSRFGSIKESEQIVDFELTKFNQSVDFTNSKFRLETHFLNTTFGNRRNSQGVIKFYLADFKKKTYFDGSDFNIDTNFHACTFNHGASFTYTTFRGHANFLEATFKGIVFFDDAQFTKFLPKFAHWNKKLRKSFRARFVAISDLDDNHDFKVDTTKPNRPIIMGKTTYKGLTYEVPVGTVVFEISDWNSSDPEDTICSLPASRAWRSS